MPGRNKKKRLKYLEKVEGPKVMKTLFDDIMGSILGKPLANLFAVAEILGSDFEV